MTKANPTDLKSNLLNAQGQPLTLVSEDKDIDSVRQTIFDMSIKGVDVGYVEDIDTETKFSLTARKLKQLGVEQILGHRITGVAVGIKGKFIENSAKQLAYFYPWNSGQAVAISPETLGGDLYELAQEVVLHPRDMGSDTSLDRTYYKAVMVTGDKLKADGAGEDALEFEMSVYPDRSHFPKIVLGQIGSGSPTFNS